ncbi:heat shock protein beta-11-like [Carcharodon carcharias]|uniref:heat shock protein beta-11-like n=1 Tax=Carcharodon carcharias TaxID=13397 RepID=UPI001B7EB6C7|nr:heat shock protein beta-11-like [Carcharodon carcharias]
MLSCRAFHPSRLCQQPVYTMWPVPHRVCEPLECNTWKQVEEARKSMNFMERVLEELTKEFLEEKARNQDNKPDDNENGKRQPEDKEGDGFSLSLDVQRFSPEELNVKVLGRKVLVTGKHEKKSDDSSGSSSYKYEEFRREFQLPEDVDAEALNCCLSQDGRLKVQAPRLALPAVNEQTVPVNITSDTTTSPRLNPGQAAQKLESGKYERKDEEEVKMDN